MKTPPTWRLDVDRCEGVVATVNVSDDVGRHVATFFGPGMESEEDSYRVPSEDEALRRAHEFVWGCGAQPEIHL